MELIIKPNFWLSCRVQQKHPTKFCTNFIVTKKLNGMQCILGAEFLLDESKVISISATGLLVINNDQRFHIPIQADKENVTSYNSNLSNISEENESENDSNISHADHVSKNLNIAHPEFKYKQSKLSIGTQVLANQYIS